MIMMIQKVFICLHDDFMCQAFPEQDQCTCIKRRLFLIAGKSYEVLQIRILRDLFHKFTVRILKLCLNDQ